MALLWNCGLTKVINENLVHFLRICTKWMQTRIFNQEYMFPIHHCMSILLINGLSFSNKIYCCGPFVNKIISVSIEFMKLLTYWYLTAFLVYSVFGSSHTNEKNVSFTWEFPVCNMSSVCYGIYVMIDSQVWIYFVFI